MNRFATGLQHLIGRLFFEASPRRALIETGILWSVAFTLLLTQLQEMLGNEPTLLVTLSPLCVLFFALRLRMPAQGWQPLLGDAFLGSTLAAALNALGMGLLWLGSQGGSLADLGVGLVVLLIATTGTWLLFMMVRAGLLLWCRFDELRRRHLRWALTYAHLLLLMLLAVPVTIVSVQWQRPPDMPENLVLQALALLMQLVLLLIPMGLLMLALFLPSALFSYFVAYRTTRGLEGLAGAAQALQRGEYGTRVPVEGEDEVAVLQHSFNAMAAQLETTMEALEEEREKADRLLLNILPESVATRLKQESLTIADHFEEATVLFADIVDFTSYSASITPEVLVGMLNEIFSTFDQLAEDYGLEKIKTIGDAYMVVGGLPEPRPDHAQAVAEMALAMQREIVRFQRSDGSPFALRIGINSGPVVAGVIGIKKFIYDLWGDTVNLASRMEAHGLSGSIQVTPQAHAYLHAHYHFEARGPIPVKGKGEVETWLLVGPNGRQLAVGAQAEGG